MKKYSKQDQRLMAVWAISCAERVLPFFEKLRPGDTRPRSALVTGREWVATGVFSMPVIRGASLSAHAAAKEVKTSEAACFAAHAAGQAVATAHVPQHAYGGAYYALKAIAVADPDNADTNIAKERDWQAAQLPAHLREEIMSRIIAQKRKSGWFFSIQKGPDF